MERSWSFFAALGSSDAHTEIVVIKITVHWLDYLYFGIPTHELAMPPPLTQRCVWRAISTDPNRLDRVHVARSNSPTRLRALRNSRAQKIAQDGCILRKMVDVALGLLLNEPLGGMLRPPAAPPNTSLPPPPPPSGTLSVAVGTRVWSVWSVARLHDYHSETRASTKRSLARRFVLYVEWCYMLYL